MYLLLLTLYNRLQIKPRITCLCYFDLPTFWRLEEKTAWKAGYKKTYIQGQCHIKTLLQIII